MPQNIHIGRSNPIRKETSDAVGTQPYICARCRNAGLPGLVSNGLTRASRSNTPPRRVPLGIVLAVDASCQLCLFFARINGGYDPELEGFPGAQWFFCCYTSLQVLGITYSQESLDATPNSLMSRVFSVNWGSEEKGEMLSTESTGFILQCLDQPLASVSILEQNFCYTGRVVYRDPNWPLFLEWLRDCDHHPTCVATLNSTPMALEVIDCQTLSILQLPPDSRYMALSYVWGQGYESSRTTASHSLCNERTVSDSIAVVKQLGERYLWVDRYCIDQHDPEEKLRAIKRMDAIYEAAYLTIVALVDSSDAGLPGVSTPRSEQPSVKLPTLSLVATMRNQDNTLQGSTWNGRAWTYQEFCLSRRCLIFADDNVHFVCKSGATSENVCHAPISSLPYQCRRGIDPRRLQLGGTGRTDRLGPLFERHLQAYGERKLTDESDALDAFRGILSRCGLDSYWGVPIFQEISKLRSIDHVDVGFAHGLAWVKHWLDNGKRSRHAMFPTWSWTSCRGPKQYLFNRAYTGSSGKRLASNLAFYSSNIERSAQIFVLDERGARSRLQDSDGIITEQSRKLIVRSIVGRSIEEPPRSSRDALVSYDDDDDCYPWGDEGDSHRLLLLLRQRHELNRSGPPPAHDSFRSGASAHDTSSRKRKNAHSKAAEGKGKPPTMGSTYWLMLRKTSKQTWVRLGVLRLSRTQNQLVQSFKTEELILE